MPLRTSGMHSRRSYCLDLRREAALFPRPGNLRNKTWLVRTSIIRAAELESKFGAY